MVTQNKSSVKRISQEETVRILNAIDTLLGEMIQKIGTINKLMNKMDAQTGMD